MIKIKCLSEEKLNEIKATWKGENTPLVCAKVSDTYTTNYDVQISDDALLIHSRIETEIYYYGSVLYLNEIDYVKIELI